MASFGSIPLSYQSPQFTNPMQAALQGMSLQQMMRQGQLQQQQQQLEGEQIRAAQMENQQRDFQLRYTQELNQAMMAGYGVTPGGGAAAASAAAPPPRAAAPPPAAVGSSAPAAAATPPAAPGPAPTTATGAASPISVSSIQGIPQIDYGRMASYVSSQLAQKGFGSMVPGFNKNYMEMAAKQAEITKAQLANEQGSLEQASNLLQGVTDPQSYAAVLPRARNLIQAGGLNPGALPDQYDPDVVKQGVAWGTKAIDMLREGREAADLHFRMAQGLPKTATEYETAYNNDISGAESQAGLDQKNLKWNAIAAQDPSGVGKSVLDAVKVPTWGPDVALSAALSNMKPEERPKFFQQRLAAGAQTLSAAAGAGDPAAYTATLKSVVAQYPETQGLWANPADVQTDPKKAAALNAQVGQTGNERISGQNLMQYREDLLGIRQQMADLSAAKAGNGAQMTPGQRQVEQRSIDNLEQGTAARPGLHSQRLDAGSDISKFQRILTTGKDAAGRDLSDDDRVKTQDKLDAATKKFNDATTTLQSVQYRKARLYGVAAPDPMDVQAAKDGDQIPASDGSTWNKKDGVAYYSGPGGAPPAAAPPAPPAPRTAPPRQGAPAAPTSAGQTSAAAPPQKLTEAQARAKATSAGKDPDAYVKLLQSKGLL